MGRSGWSAAHWRRASDCRTIPAPSRPSATRGPVSNTSARRRISGSTASRSRSTPTRRTSSGSSATSGTASPGSGHGSPRRLAGAGVQSLDDALRELQLEPIHGPFRAIFADGLTVAVLDGVATSAQLDELERRVVAFLSAVAEATGVDGDPAAIAKRIRARAQRAFVGMAVSAEDAGFAAAAALLRRT